MASLNRNRLFPFGAVVALAILAWWRFDERQPEQRPSEQTQTTYYFADFSLHVTRPDGRTDYTVRGKRMVHYQQADVSIIEQPVWTVYMPSGAPWYGRSDNGRMWAGGSEVLLRGKVRLNRPASSVNPSIALETQRLHLLPHEDYADTDTPVTVYGRDFHIDATGARAWMRTQRVQLLAEVEGYYAAASH